MTKKRSNLLNQRFGRLTVIERAEDQVSQSGNKKSRWICKCECGVIKEINQSHLKSGRIASCGCLSVEIVTERNTKHGLASRKDRASEYMAWCAMKARCSNPNLKFWYIYKDKDVCPEWKNNFEQFYKDMGPKPSPNHSLDRFNGLLGYNAYNCRWATASEQAINQKTPKSNTSGYKHIVVKQNKKSTKYKVQIVREKNLRFTKTFSTIEEAIIARDNWLKNYDKNKF